MRGFAGIGLAFSPANGSVEIGSADWLPNTALVLDGLLAAVHITRHAH
jgi:hypothetical protein